MKFLGEEFTIIKLNAADAGEMTLQTSIPSISVETRILCIQFIKHYQEKGVTVDIEISGPLSDDQYNEIIDQIIELG